MPNGNGSMRPLELLTLSVSLFSLSFYATWNVLSELNRRKTYTEVVRQEVRYKLNGGLL